jgi:glucose-6-phosphate 1-dehydrogenase
MDIGTAADFEILSSLLRAYDARYFYLATGHELFISILEGIEQARLHQCAQVRVVFEKPFGTDGMSARALDARLKELFSEKQLFRIDHYLAKERVHTLLDRKYRDASFEQQLNTTHIRSIRILVHEAGGVGERLSYYHTSGVLRDMIQNHLVQMLSLLLLNVPSSHEASALHDAKDALLESLSLGTPSEHLLGQYASYAAEVQRAGLALAPTPTFARVTFYSSLPRWQGVPFILETGKKVSERYGTIVITFRDGREERIDINPRGEMQQSDGYAFLLDALFKGESTWFAREDEVLEGWRLVDGIEAIRNEIRFVTYADGTIPV